MRLNHHDKMSRQVNNLRTQTTKSNFYPPITLNGMTAQAKAEEIADELQPEELRRLMYYLVDTVLDRTNEVKPTIAITDLSYEEVLPIIA